MLALAAAAAAAAAATSSQYTLQNSFVAFAACEGRDAQEKLAKRLEFLRGIQSEEEVRKLPEHVALNEQEQLLALQQTLLPPGTAVHLVGLKERTALNGCVGTLISCLRDGTFRCAVEARCAEAEVQDVRVHMANLRPVRGCAAAVPPPCEGESGGDETLSGPLTNAAIGERIVRSMQAHERLSKDGALSERLRSEDAPRLQLGPTLPRCVIHSSQRVTITRLLSRAPSHQTTGLGKMASPSLYSHYSLPFPLPYVPSPYIRVSYDRPRQDRLPRPVLLCARLRARLAAPSELRRLPRGGPSERCRRGRQGARAGASISTCWVSRIHMVASCC